MEQELDEELQIHLAQQIEKEIACGKTPEEARYAALRAIGGIEQLKEECRDSRRVRWLQDLVQDLAYAARTLAQKPSFTLAAVSVLALGIGASTAVFTVVNRVLLRPLPYQEPDRLQIVSCVPRHLGFDPGPIMVDRDYLEFRRHNRSFESLAALGSSVGGRMTLTRHGDPVVLTASLVGPDILRVLRVHPSLGRAFLPGGKSDPNVVLLSNRLWRTRFGGEPGAVGEAVTLDGNSYSIAGVMPETFSFQSADLWVRNEIRLDPHNIFFIPVVGRLKADVTPLQAQAELSTFASSLPHDGELSRDGFTARIVPLKELFVADVRRLLQVFAGAVAFVFLIACANFANLLLIRGAGRQPEIAVRAALGASRWRLVRQLLAESTLLSLIGATLGLVLSFAAVRALLALLPPEKVPSAGNLPLDIPVLIFTIGLSLLTGVVFGLAPALQATRRELREGVTEGGRSVLGRREWLRGALVSAEIALALILLTGAGLLVKSFLRMRAVNPGFQAAKVTVATVDLPEARYHTAEQMRQFDERVLSAVQSLPGAESAAAVSFLPFGYGVMGDFQLEDGRHLPEDFQVDKPEISPDYFRAMGIPLIRGRAFTERDDLAVPGVVIISESVARRLWPGDDAIGKRISMEDHPKPQDWLTIVGVAGTVRQQGLADKLGAVVYQPYKQIKMPGFISHMSFVARSEQQQAIARQMREVIHRIDRDLPTESVTAMGAIIDDAMTGARSQTRLLGIFSAVALLLAAIGIYGVLACSVAERTHEIGIRMALGADHRDILWMIIRRTLVLTGSGVLIGTLGALTVTGVLNKLLFEIKPTDPATFFSVIVILTSAALLAAWLPARRAATVLPLVALRHE
jgi:predicted permease